MKEEIKAIVNDIQLVVKDHARMSAQRHVYELGKKQFQDSRQHCEWGDVRQKKLDEINTVLVLGCSLRGQVHWI